MRLSWAALIAALGCAGCGPRNILWTASCTVTCSNGGNLSNAQTVCEASTASAEDAAAAANAQCQSSVALESNGCATPTCDCVAVKNATDC